ncbi:hypothetical protein R1sor_010470 [Riccia sorocarpa]|uniref:Uncharacterized protein n=1 Tax=Riccia sorocarpa TaxID=122646 RepID=A0ABD3I483_9MARC
MGDGLHTLAAQIERNEEERKRLHKLMVESKLKEVVTLSNPKVGETGETSRELPSSLQQNRVSPPRFEHTWRDARNKQPASHQPTQNETPKHVDQGDPFPPLPRATPQQIRQIPVLEPVRGGGQMAAQLPRTPADNRRRAHENAKIYRERKDLAWREATSHTIRECPLRRQQQEARRPGGQTAQTGEGQNGASRQAPGREEDSEGFTRVNGRRPRTNNAGRPPVGNRYNVLADSSSEDELTDKEEDPVQETTPTREETSTVHVHKDTHGNLAEGTGQEAEDIPQQTLDSTEQTEDSSMEVEAVKDKRKRDDLSLPGDAPPATTNKSKGNTTTNAEPRDSPVLQDGWLLANVKEGAHFTRQQKVNGRLDQARLDRIYFTKCERWAEKSVKVQHDAKVMLSDHRPVVLTLMSGSDSRRRRANYFKTAPELMKSEEVKNMIQETWKENGITGEDPRRNWDWKWGATRRVLIQETKKLRQEHAIQRERLKELKRERIMVSQLRLNRADDTLLRLEQEIKQIETKREAELRRWSRSKWLGLGEAPSKFYFKILKAKKAKEDITC